MRFGLAILILILPLSGCGSPILDHEVTPKPKISKSVTSPRQASDVKRAVQNSKCEYQIESTPLCASLRFFERPTHQESLKSFEAELLIWDTRTPPSKLDLKASPRAYHRCETECCPPPDILVESSGPGLYRLRNVEFHASGWFDFLIQVHSREFGILRVQIPIEVFDE